MSSAAPTHFEIRGREIKTARLVAAVDQEFRGDDDKFDPFAYADKIAEALSGWTPGRWRVLAAKYEIRNPSPTTRAQVIARYRARAVEYLAELDGQPEPEVFS